MIPIIFLGTRTLGHFGTVLIKNDLIQVLIRFVFKSKICGKMRCFEAKFYDCK